MSTKPEARPELNFDPNVPFRFLLQAYPYWNEYREECLKLLLEAKRALESGCPTASAIASGEALMRALCDRALYFLPDANCPVNWRAIVENAGNHGLLDVCFRDLIDAFGQLKAYEPRTIQQMDDVRCLRNAAVHRAPPLVDQWDPDDPREDIRPALQPGFEWPEGYRIYLNLVKMDKNGKPRTAEKQNSNKGGNGKIVDESRWVYFDCRKYGCTLKLWSFLQQQHSIPTRRLQTATRRPIAKRREKRT